MRPLVLLLLAVVLSCLVIAAFGGDETKRNNTRMRTTDDEDEQDSDESEDEEIQCFPRGWKGERCSCVKRRRDCSGTICRRGKGRCRDVHRRSHCCCQGNFPARDRLCSRRG